MFKEEQKWQICVFFAKFSYDDCVKAFGTSDFASKLDQINVGAKEGTITVYSVAYCYGR